MDNEIFLVTAATGTVGSDLVMKLAQAAPNSEIRCATRDPESRSAKALQAYGKQVKPVKFDVNEPDTLKAVCEGVTQIYLLPPFLPNTMVEWHQSVMDAAQETGDLRYVVKHSVIGARAPKPDDMPSGVPLLHYRGEEVVMATGVDYSVIRPTIFAQHFIKMPWVYEKGDDNFYLPIGSAKVAFLDARDIATLAVFLLTQEDKSPYSGQAYELTGPSAVTGVQMSDALSQAAGREIGYVDPAEDEFVARIRRFGGSEGIANIYREAKEGWFGHVISPDFERVMRFP
ncbi:MAG: NmrA family NAD(P)-binding protein, partial [Sphaerospermopsis sp. SIO1G2]|nr:NmrA family NAD(P)-binding protein [Sphaerospermopsis sp. SIO1G2]